VIRAYTIATAALALDASPKWLDNILSHYKLSGVIQERQGVARRITIDGLLTLSVTQLLTVELGLTVSQALQTAGELIAGEGAFTSGSLKLELDLVELRTRLISQLESAVEVAPLPRRGRPPRNTTGRLD
jgi:hypothetical protein